MENNKAQKKAIIRERIFVSVILVIILLLFVYFFKDIMLPLFEMQLNNDLDGASELLVSKGFMGGVSVILIEALQMVVIFISAEFIQIASGLSYPIYLSVPLCDLGVCLGATIIYLLVRVFKFKSTSYEKRKGKIEKFASEAKDRNTVLLLYLLFFMPFIPFGAICYYGSTTKISYGKYMLTVATSAIPSVLVSVAIGRAGMLFFTSNIPLWLLVVIVIVLSVLLFLLIYWFMHRFVLKDTDKTPDSLFFDIFFTVVKVFQFGKKKPVVEDELLAQAEPPYLILANHESFMDFSHYYYLSHLKNPSCVINKYYCDKPLFRLVQKHCGFIPIKLFSCDTGAVVKIRNMIKRGYPVVIYPEGRLSPDGRTNPIVEKGGSFFKKLGVDIVIANVDGAYYAHPKWRRRTYSTEIKVSVRRVLKKDEIAAMSADELDRVIEETLYNDASLRNKPIYRQKDKAAGLEKILYRCADCGALYKTVGKGNELKCTACGKVHVLDNSYHFTDDIHSIPEYYDAIRRMEEKDIDSLSLVAEVSTKVFNDKSRVCRKESGICTLTPKAFRYSSDSVEFSIPTEKIPALAFSCGKEFELYHDNKLHYFYPKEDPVQVARWALIIDILTDRRNKYTDERR